MIFVSFSHAHSSANSKEEVHLNCFITLQCTVRVCVHYCVVHQHRMMFKDRSLPHENLILCAINFDIKNKLKTSWKWKHKMSGLTFLCKIEYLFTCALCTAHSKQNGFMGKQFFSITFSIWLHIHSMELIFLR